MAFNKPLYDAAESGQLAQCEAAILNNADVNWRNPTEVMKSAMLNFSYINRSVYQFISVDIARCIQRCLCALPVLYWLCMGWCLALISRFLFASTIVQQCIRPPGMATPM